MWEEHRNGFFCPLLERAVTWNLGSTTVWPWKCYLISTYQFSLVRHKRFGLYDLLLHIQLQPSIHVHNIYWKILFILMFLGSSDCNLWSQFCSLVWDLDYCNVDGAHWNIWQKFHQLLHWSWIQMRNRKAAWLSHPLTSYWVYRNLLQFILPNTVARKRRQEPKNFRKWNPKALEPKRTG